MEEPLNPQLPFFLCPKSSISSRSLLRWLSPWVEQCMGVRLLVWESLQVYSLRRHILASAASKHVMRASSSFPSVTKWICCCSSLWEDTMGILHHSIISIRGFMRIIGGSLPWVTEEWFRRVFLNEWAVDISRFYEIVVLRSFSIALETRGVVVRLFWVIEVRFCNVCLCDIAICK